mgnify:CR=1 FL=1
MTTGTESEIITGNLLTGSGRRISSVEGGVLGQPFEYRSPDGYSGLLTVNEDGSFRFVPGQGLATLDSGETARLAIRFSTQPTNAPAVFGNELIVNGTFQNAWTNWWGWGIHESVAGWTSPVGQIEVQARNFGFGNGWGDRIIDLGSNAMSTIEQTVAVAQGGVYRQIGRAHV